MEPQEALQVTSLLGAGIFGMLDLYDKYYFITGNVCIIHYLNRFIVYVRVSYLYLIKFFVRKTGAFGNINISPYKLRKLRFYFLSINQKNQILVLQSLFELIYQFCVVFIDMLCYIWSSNKSWEVNIHLLGVGRYMLKIIRTSCECVNNNM